MFSTLAAVLIAFSLVDGFHEKREPGASAYWNRRHEVVPKDTELSVSIFITQSNIQDGHQHLMDVSDPASPRYGQHWSADMVRRFFSPPQQNFELVEEWLTDSGISHSRHKKTRESVSFTASIMEVENLLNATYHFWEHIETGSLEAACDSYHIPEHLIDIVDYVTPTIGLGFAKARLHSRRSDLPVKHHNLRVTTTDRAMTSCANLVTPQCIQELYSIPEPGINVPGNDLGIYESGDTYAQQDLDLFFRNHYPIIPNGTQPKLISVDGGTAPGPLSVSGGESTLDLDCAYPIVWPQGIRLYQTLDNKTAFSSDVFGALDDFLNAIDGSFCTYDGGDDYSVDASFPNTGYPHSEQCGTYKATNVISVSYTATEAFYSSRYAQRQCYEYMKLGLQGVTFIFASGDGGTLSVSPFVGCLKPGGRDNPGFPASCPYVTSVGATQLSGNQEQAVSPTNERTFTSGGGFSNVFARPAYQNTAVETYLARSHRNTSLFNISGRGFPDVSAVGLNIATYARGKPYTNFGTSASTPIFAAMVNRINGERLLLGKKPLGFLNPVLYAHPEMFNDITDGCNLACNASIGFKATIGWDPVTGLGTPSYPKMRTVLLSLP